MRQRDGREETKRRAKTLTHFARLMIVLSIFPAYEYIPEATWVLNELRRPSDWYAQYIVFRRSLFFNGRIFFTKCSRVNGPIREFSVV